MKKILIPIVLLLLVGCGPEDTPRKPPPPVADQPNAPMAGEQLDFDYRVQLRSKNVKTGRSVRRPVECVVSARGANDVKLFVIDARTGNTTPVEQVVRITSQNRLRIFVWANVRLIFVECTMLGEQDENLTCEFSDSRDVPVDFWGTRVLENVIEEDDKDAFCFAIIDVVG